MDKIISDVYQSDGIKEKYKTVMIKFFGVDGEKRFKVPNNI
jgi:hypothetical protein